MSCRNRPDERARAWPPRRGLADANDVHGIPQTGARLFDDVQMVREYDGLNAIADRRERFEASGCAGFVKARENIVANKRRRLGARGIILDIGEAKRKIELVARAFAQMRDRRPLAVGPAGFELASSSS